MRPWRLWQWLALAIARVALGVADAARAWAARASRDRADDGPPAFWADLVRERAPHLLGPGPSTRVAHPGVLDGGGRRAREPDGPSRRGLTRLGPPTVDGRRTTGDALDGTPVVDHQAPGAVRPGTGAAATDGTGSPRAEAATERQPTGDTEPTGEPDPAPATRPELRPVFRERPSPATPARSEEAGAASDAHAPLAVPRQVTPEPATPDRPRPPLGAAAPAFRPEQPDTSATPDRPGRRPHDKPGTPRSRLAPWPPRDQSPPPADRTPDRPPTPAPGTATRRAWPGDPLPDVAWSTPRAGAGPHVAVPEVVAEGSPTPDAADRWSPLPPSLLDSQMTAAARRGPERGRSRWVDLPVAAPSAHVRAPRAGRDAPLRDDQEAR